MLRLRPSQVMALGAFGLLAACGDSSPTDTAGPATGDAGGATPASPPPSSDAGPEASVVPPPNADAGDAGDEPPPHRVTDCKNLPAQGTWENITPTLSTLPQQAPCPYGGAFVVDPQDSATIYLGTCNQGIWKTANCGAQWAHVNTGKNGNVLDGGRQWTFAIDPSDSQRIYTNSGYGAASNGAFVSSNGGVDWEQLWPPSDPAQASIVQYNFVAQVRLDPTNHLHLIVTFHATCAAPHPASCFAESLDAGKTFRIVDGRSEWAGGEGQSVYFLENDRTWLYSSQSNGLWRSADSGASWTMVAGDQGHAAGELYRSKSGVFYLPSTTGILRSPDGVTWTLVPNSGSTMFGLTGNGTTMWASRGFPWDPSTTLYEPFWSSPESDGLTWTQISSPQLSNGEQLEYDSDHKVLYSSNGGAGFWRVVLQ